MGIGGAQPVVNNGKIGIVSYTYRASFQKDVAATLDTIKSLGITNMEFSNLFGRTAKEIRALLDERGMRCTSFGIGYDDLINHTHAVAENAKTLGATFVRVAWIPHDTQAPFSLAATQKAVDDFNRVGKILKEEYGLYFATTTMAMNLFLMEWVLILIIW